MSSANWIAHPHPTYPNSVPVASSVWKEHHHRVLLRGDWADVKLESEIAEDRPAAARTSVRSVKLSMTNGQGTVLPGTDVLPPVLPARPNATGNPV